MSSATAPEPPGVTAAVPGSPKLWSSAAARVQAIGDDLPLPSQIGRSRDQEGAGGGIDRDAVRGVGELAPGNGTTSIPPPSPPPENPLSSVPLVFSRTSAV